MNIGSVKFLVLILSLALLSSACSSKRVTRLNDQIYDPVHDLKLDVYAPQNIQTPKKILVFIHGGNWIRGKKSIYRFFGKGMAGKNVVCIVINYRLSPTTNMAGMAEDIATSIKWTKENAVSFGGDPDKIFISGHSAGGQLAALLALDDHYFEKLKMANPIKGVVLIDAYGLDMFSYLSHSNGPRDTTYKRIFTEDPANWKKYSPIYHLNKNKPEFIQFVGGKTNTIIKEMNAAFYDELKKYQPNARLLVVKRKRHVPMMFQFYNRRVKTYGDILNFIKP